MNTIKHLVGSVGYEQTEKDDHLKKLNRVVAIDWACLLEDSTCIKNMKEKLDKWLETPANGMYA